jgi:hypothetical protein
LLFERATFEQPVAAIGNLDHIARRNDPAPSDRAKYLHRRKLDTTATDGRAAAHEATAVPAGVR